MLAACIFGRVVTFSSVILVFGNHICWYLFSEVRDCFGSTSLDTLSTGEKQPSTGTKSLSPEVKSSISNSEHDLSNNSEKPGIVQQNNDILQNIGSDSQSDVHLVSVT